VAGAILAIIPAVSLAATDTFTRVVGSGWGTADTGGVWTADASPASFSVGGTSGRLVLSAAGQNRAIFLASTAVDWDVKTDLSLDKAPVGGGPNRPDTCMKSYSYGEEAIVLRIRSAAGPTELVIRYSGCDHRGFDDGVAVRRLTAGALAPFIAGPHQQYVPILDR